MNVFLWTLQILFALHTWMGAYWKFLKTAEETMPSLASMSSGAWHGLAILEIIAGALLLLPVVKKLNFPVVSLGAGFIVLEMLVFVGIHLGSGDKTYGSVVYWGVVAVLCGILSFGRWKYPI